MIYTIGKIAQHEQLYEPYTHRYPFFSNESIFLREGGSVWSTMEAANDYINEQRLENFSTYLVDADWEKDTAPSESGLPHRLIRHMAQVHAPNCFIDGNDPYAFDNYHVLYGISKSDVDAVIQTFNFAQWSPLAFSEMRNYVWANTFPVTALLVGKAVWQQLLTDAESRHWLTRASMGLSAGLLGTYADVKIMRSLLGLVEFSPADNEAYMFSRPEKLFTTHGVQRKLNARAIVRGVFNTGS